MKLYEVPKRPSEENLIPEYEDIEYSKQIKKRGRMGLDEEPKKNGLR